MKVMDVELNARCDILQLNALNLKDQLTARFNKLYIEFTSEEKNMKVCDFWRKYRGAADLRSERKLGISGTPGKNMRIELYSPAAQRAMEQMSKRRARKAGGAPSTFRAQATARSFAQHSSARGTSGFVVSLTPGRANPPSGIKPRAMATPTQRLLFNSRLPETPMQQQQLLPPASGQKLARALRRGESLMSVNGSPIVSDETTNIALVLSQDPETLKNLEDKEGREKTKQALEAMRNKLDSMVKAMENVDK